MDCETFESAMMFSQASLEALDVPQEEAAAIIADVRRRDLERLKIQRVEGIAGGRHLMKRNTPEPTPLTPVRRPAKPLNIRTTNPEPPVRRHRRPKWQRKSPDT